MQRNIFLTGGTGYLGQKLAAALIERGHKVTMLARKNSFHKVPLSCKSFEGNALDSASYKDQLKNFDTFIHLVGVAHPSPKKEKEFIAIDLESVKQAAKALANSNVKHIIYVSVAQTPTKVMKAYQEVRAEGEQIFFALNIPLTIIRPWYVIGPGHWWPLFFLPVFKILEWLPFTSDKAKKLSLVSLKQMINSLKNAVENPPQQIKHVEIKDIKKGK